jgi:hypothetical protein
MKLGNDLDYDLDYVFKVKTGSNKYAGTNANVSFLGNLSFSLIKTKVEKT